MLRRCAWDCALRQRTLQSFWISKRCIVRCRQRILAVAACSMNFRFIRPCPRLTGAMIYMDRNYRPPDCLRDALAQRSRHRTSFQKGEEPGTSAFALTETNGSINKTAMTVPHRAEPDTAFCERCVLIF